MKRALLIAAAGLLVTLVVLAIIYQRNLERVAFAASLLPVPRSTSTSTGSKISIQSPG